MSNYDNWKTSPTTDHAAEYANRLLDCMTWSEMQDLAILEELADESSKSNEVEEALFEHFIEEYYNTED